jgi:hypothetical protein
MVHQFEVLLVYCVRPRILNNTRTPGTEPHHTTPPRHTTQTHRHTERCMHKYIYSNIGIPTMYNYWQYELVRNTRLKIKLKTKSRFKIVQNNKNYTLQYYVIQGTR